MTIAIKPQAMIARWIKFKVSLLMDCRETDGNGQTGAGRRGGGCSLYSRRGSVAGYGSHCFRDPLTIHHQPDMASRWQRRFWISTSVERFRLGLIIVCLFESEQRFLSTLYS